MASAGTSNSTLQATAMSELGKSLRLAMSPLVPLYSSQPRFGRSIRGSEPAMIAKAARTPFSLNKDRNMLMIHVILAATTYLRRSRE